MPIKGMRIGAFGWAGTYARKGTYTADEQGNPLHETKTGKREVKRNRYAISGEYKANDWTLRAEYIHSQGRAFKNAYTGSSTNAELNYSLGDKADGWYALCIAPVAKTKLGTVHAKARYNVYRQNAEWGDSYSQYEAGVDWWPTKNLTLDLEYIHSNDRRLATDSHNYEMLNAQVSFRF